MRGTRLLYALFLVSSFAVSSCAAELTEQTWTEARSPNFIVIGNASQKQVRQTALHLEQFRAAFQKAFPSFRMNAAEPVVVFALKDEKTMKELLPSLWAIPNGARPAGAFVGGWENNFAVLRTDLGYDSQEIVDHEYVHELEHLNFVALPLWLTEGMAEFFATAEISDREVKLGMPSKRLEQLRRMQSLRIGLPQLLKAGPAKIDKDRWFAYDFYAESWALTHMLILGRNMGNGAKMDEYIQRLGKGSDQIQAFEESFGKLNDVYGRLDRYVRDNGMYVLGMKNPPQIESLAITERQLTAGEVAVYFAEFEYRQGGIKESGEWLEKAIRLNPDLNAAHRMKAFLSFGRGQDDEAVAEFEKAVALDSKDYLSKYFLTMMKFGHPKSEADVEQLIRSLKEVRALNPNFAPVHVELSQAYVRAGRLDNALQAAQYAAQLEPGRAGYHCNVARIMLLKGDASGAAAVARFVAERWAGTDRDEAIEIWQSTVGLDKSAGAPPLAAHHERIQSVESKALFRRGALFVFSRSEAYHSKWSGVGVLLLTEALSTPRL